MDSISVIIPLYKGERYVEKLLDNLRRCVRKKRKNENYQLEVIFVNDDPETEIKIKHSDVTEFAVNMIQNEENQGIHYSRICGLQQAKGEYILFLDQDDYIEDRYFESQLAHIGDKNVVICNGKYRNDREIIYSREEAERIADLKDYFSTLSGIISPGQALIRRKCIPSVWMENILSGNYCDDAFLWLLLKNEGERFAINQEILYYHKEDGNNASFQWKHTADAIEEMYDVIEKKALLKEKNRLLLKACVQKKVQKHRQYAQTEQKLQEMLLKKEQIRDYLKQDEITSLAVYGYGVYGKKLLACLEEGNVQVAYVIDEHAGAFKQTRWQLKTMREKLEEVDLVVVTPIFAFEAIREQLSTKINSKCISLDEFCDRVVQYA